MKKTLVFLISVVLLSACGFIGNRSKDASSGNSAVTSAPKFQAGSDVLFMFDEYHFYEAKLLSVEENKAKLLYDGRNVEKDLTEIYSIPKVGDKPAVKVGDFVAARYGKLPTWPTAKVKEIKDDKITVEWNTGSNSTMEVTPENVIAVSPAAAVKIKEAAAKKGR